MKGLVFLCACLSFVACGEGDGMKDDGGGAGAVAALDTLPVLIRNIQKCSKLYTSEYNIRKIITHSDEPRLKGKVLGHEIDMKMPVGDRKIAIPINVTLKAYIDFAGFSQDNVVREGRRITIILPEPQVTVTSSKVDQKGIREYVSLTRSRFSDEEMADFEKQGRQAVVKSIPRLDIKETARLNAAQLLIPMIMKMGFDEKDITVVFRNEELLRMKNKE
ncbi:MAG: DUF4230 domain-containing protein [Prevotella sp.]